MAGKYEKSSHLDGPLCPSAGTRGHSHCPLLEFQLYGALGTCMTSPSFVVSAWFPTESEPKILTKTAKILLCRTKDPS